MSFLDVWVKWCDRLRAFPVTVGDGWNIAQFLKAIIQVSPRTDTAIDLMEMVGYENIELSSLLSDFLKTHNFFDWNNPLILSPGTVWIL